MQSKVIQADYRHDNSSSMKKRLLRTKKTTEDRPTPADADSVPLVITVNISSFVKCDLLHKIEVISVTQLYGYQFANFSEI